MDIKFEHIAGMIGAQLEMTKFLLVRMAHTFGPGDWWYRLKSETMAKMKSMPVTAPTPEAEASIRLAGQVWVDEIFTAAEAEIDPAFMNGGSYRSDLN